MPAMLPGPQKWPHEYWMDRQPHLLYGGQWKVFMDSSGSSRKLGKATLKCLLHFMCYFLCGYCLSHKNKFLPQFKMIQQFNTGSHGPLGQIVLTLSCLHSDPDPLNTVVPELELRLSHLVGLRKCRELVPHSQCF